MHAANNALAYFLSEMTNEYATYIAKNIIVPKTLNPERKMSLIIEKDSKIKIAGIRNLFFFGEKDA